MSRHERRHTPTPKDTFVPEASPFSNETHFKIYAVIGNIVDDMALAAQSKLLAGRGESDAALLTDDASTRTARTMERLNRISTALSPGEPVTPEAAAWMTESFLAHRDATPIITRFGRNMHALEGKTGLPWSSLTERLTKSTTQEIPTTVIRTREGVQRVPILLREGEEAVLARIGVNMEHALNTSEDPRMQRAETLLKEPSASRA